MDILDINNNHFKIYIYRQYTKYNIKIINIDNNNTTEIKHNHSIYLNDKFKISLCYMLLYDSCIHYVANNLSQLIYSITICKLTLEELLSIYKKKGILINFIKDYQKCIK